MPPRPAITDPWPLLSRVLRSRVEVLRPAAGGLRLQHEGAGVVDVTTGAGTITWQERGRWTGGELAGLAFHNAIRWRRVGDAALEVSHLRRGAEQPTFLVELRPKERGWRAVAPHHCGADRYDAWLGWTAKELSLRWEVSSPTDPYTLRWTAPLR